MYTKRVLSLLWLDFASIVCWLTCLFIWDIILCRPGCPSPHSLSTWPSESWDCGCVPLDWAVHSFCRLSRLCKLPPVVLPFSSDTIVKYRWCKHREDRVISFPCHLTQCPPHHFCNSSALFYRLLNEYCLQLVNFLLLVFLYGLLFCVPILYFSLQQVSLFQMYNFLPSHLTCLVFI